MSSELTKYEDSLKNYKIIIEDERNRFLKFYPKEPTSNLLCSVLGHDYRNFEYYIDSENNPIPENQEDEESRLSEIVSYCLRCEFSRMEIFKKRSELMN